MGQREDLPSLDRHIPEIICRVEEQALGSDPDIPGCPACAKPFHFAVIRHRHTFTGAAGHLGDGIHGTVLLEFVARDAVRGLGQGFEGFGIIGVPPVVLEEIPAGVRQQVGHLGIIGFTPDQRTRRQAPGLGAAVQSIGHVFRMVRLVALLQGDFLLPFGVGTLPLGHVGRGVRLAFRFAGGPALHFRAGGIPGSQDRLLFGTVALLVGYGFLLIGNILHLLADPLHDRRILLSGQQAVHLLLQRSEFAPGMLAAHAIGDHRHTGDHHQCRQCDQ